MFPGSLAGYFIRKVKSSEVHPIDAGTNNLAPVTVIIPCFNCSRTLPRSVSSVASQTLKPVELILVNDASTDNTREIIEKLQSMYGSEWIKTVNLVKNGGPATARNSGWALATQPYIAFLDSDDSWDLAKIDRQYHFMSTHPEYVLTGHGFIQIADETNIEKGIRQSRLENKYQELNLRKLLVSNRLATRTIMLRSDLPHRFQEGRRYSEDYLLWLQLAGDGYSLALLEDKLAYTFKSAYSDGGLASNLWKMELGELTNFWKIYREGRISIVTTVSVMLLSLAKYLRRVFVKLIGKMRPTTSNHK